MRINSNRAFGSKSLRNSGLGQKSKDNLRKGLKGGIAAAAVLGGLAVAVNSGVAHQQEKQHQENKSDLLGDLKPMTGPIQKSSALENLPAEPIFIPEAQGQLLLPSEAVAGPSPKDIALAAAKAAAAVVAGEASKKEAVKAVAAVAAHKPEPEGQNIIDQRRDAEVVAAHNANKVVGADDASVKDLLKIGKNKLKNKFKKP